MYQDFYGFSKRPFTLVADPDFVYLGKTCAATLDTMASAIAAARPYCVITGAAGTGKSTLLGKLLEQEHKTCCIRKVDNVHFASSNVRLWMSTAFNLFDSEDGFPANLIDFVRKQQADKKTCALVIDEAQQMTSQAIIDLCRISGLVRQESLHFVIILLGQPQLEDALKEAQSATCNLQIDHAIEPLDADETATYIKQRISHAGGAPTLFTDAACRAVHEQTGGIARLINLTCDAALMNGASSQANMIDEDIIAVVDRNRDSSEDSLGLDWMTDEQEAENFDMPLGTDEDTGDFIKEALAGFKAERTETIEELKAASEVKQKEPQKAEEPVDEIDIDAADVARMTDNFFSEPEPVAEAADPLPGLDMILRDEEPEDRSLPVQTGLSRDELTRRGRMLDKISLLLLLVLIILLWQGREFLPSLSEWSAAFAELVSWLSTLAA